MRHVVLVTLMPAFCAGAANAADKPAPVDENYLAAQRISVPGSLALGRHFTDRDGEHVLVLARKAGPSPSAPASGRIEHIALLAALHTRGPDGAWRQNWTIRDVNDCPGTRQQRGFHHQGSDHHRYRPRWPARGHCPLSRDLRRRNRAGHGQGHPAPGALEAGDPRRGGNPAANRRFWRRAYPRQGPACVPQRCFQAASGRDLEEGVHLPPPLRGRCAHCTTLMITRLLQVSRRSNLGMERLLISPAIAPCAALRRNHAGRLHASG